MQVAGADGYGLVESAAHGQQQALEGDVVGDVGVADGAEQDSVVGFQQLQPVVRHHFAGLAVVGRPPRIFGVVEDGASRCGGKGVQHLAAFRDDFGTHTVTGDDGQAVLRHLSLSSL